MLKKGQVRAAVKRDRFLGIEWASRRGRNEVLSKGLKRARFGSGQCERVTVGVEVSLYSPYDWPVGKGWTVCGTSSLFPHDRQYYVSWKGVVPTVGAGLKSIWDAAVVIFVDGYGDRSHNISMLSLLLPVVLLFAAAVNLVLAVWLFASHKHSHCYFFFVLSVWVGLDFTLRRRTFDWTLFLFGHKINYV
ncbi:hypothetical protein L6452_09377 [Arctium lappa]|uniref:Uncharacterized protein n=1 Tax=Arctium lappa TaxID=4217 RepID=A0ACB9DKJ5_ARCLA|nr:hypothetical protein L6452_09377 [Arctium lappa]